jgi:hypothetical protein
MRLLQAYCLLKFHALFFTAPLKGWLGSKAIRVGVEQKNGFRQKNNTIKNNRQLFYLAALVLAT